MKLTSKIIIEKFTVPALLIMNIAIVNADDAKTYPGSMGVDKSGLLKISSSAIGNTSTTRYAYVDLPIINDESYQEIKYSWVKAVDRNPNRNVSVKCSLYSVQLTSSSRVYGFFGQAKTTSLNNKEEKLMTGGLSTNSGYQQYHEYFSCRIPPAYNRNLSYIHSYHATED